jgi:hypothetical protein
MPLTEKEISHADMLKAERDGLTCLECGARLSVAWGGTFGYNSFLLRCGMDIKHKGVKRDFELTPANIPGFNLYDAGAKRRKKLEKQIGTDRALAIRKYQGVISLNRDQATEILEAIWPDAPPEEKLRAALLCKSYQLNPLMKHIFLVPFNKGKQNESWATVMGINATRLLAARSGTFSYVDDTPRMMTDEEQIRRFGQAYPERFYVIVKVRDPKTGAEAPGYGWYPKEREKMVWDDQAKRKVVLKKDGKNVKEANDPYGSDMGNTIFNMAAIRAERQALSRLRPGEMPTDVEVMEESLAERASVEGMDVVEVEGRVIDETTGEIIEAKVLDVKTTGEKSVPEKPPILPDASPTANPGGEKVLRDPDTIKNTTDLVKVCYEDWPGIFKSSKDVAKELGLTSFTMLTDKPADAYRKIAAVRNKQ